MFNLAKRYGCIGYCKILSQRHPNMQLLRLPTRMVFLVPIPRLIVRQSSTGHPILSLLYGVLLSGLSRAELPPNSPGYQGEGQERLIILSESIYKDK